MKKLFYLLALLAGSMAFTSCDTHQDPHNPYPWKPTETKLNTSDSRVGSMCTADGRITTNNDEAEGILFAVDGNTGYLCSFTNIMKSTVRGRNVVWDLEGISWSSSYDTVPIGTGLYTSVYDSAAGEFEKRTEQITDGEILTDMIVADTTIESSAAARCRNYYRIHCYTNATEHNADNQFIDGRGEWYLPSAQELQALLKVKNKINNLYLDGSQPADTVVTTTYFQAIGGSRGYAYWSATEFNASCAWYRITADNDQSYLQKNFNGGGSTVSKMLVRPIRKVTLQ